MKGFWALPAVLRVALASHATFTVLDDILSYPQYEITLSNEALNEADAEFKIAAISRSSPSASSPSASSPDLDASVDISQFRNGDGDQAHSSEEEKPKERVRDYERIRLGSQEYLCSIPEAIPHNDTVDIPSPEEQEQEVIRATNQGWDLLKGMEGSCIFFNTGWWTYSFCFNQSIKQFHSLPPGRQIPLWPPVEDKTVQSYVLGQFGDPSQASKGSGKKTTELREREKPAATAAADVGDRKPVNTGPSNTTETGLARLEQKGDLKYMVQELSGGTTCDLTGKPRRVEVQFHCHPGVPGDRIAAIKELATCTYLMIIQTARLCNDVAFQPPRKDKPNPIRCSPIIADGTELADYPLLQQLLEAREHTRQAEEEDTVLLDAELPIYVGDVEFGGNRLLASPSTLDPDSPELDAELAEISKTGWLKDRDSLANSLVLGGHREKLIATVAASGQEPLTPEKLKELGIRDREVSEINKFRKEMNKLSKGKAWKLDVIETAQGREFRGIIEAEDGLLEQAKGATEAGKAPPKKEQAPEGQTKDGSMPQTAKDDDGPEEGSQEVYKDEL